MAAGQELSKLWGEAAYDCPLSELANSYLSCHSLDFSEDLKASSSQRRISLEHRVIPRNNRKYIRYRYLSIPSHYSHLISQRLTASSILIKYNTILESLYSFPYVPLDPLPRHRVPSESQVPGQSPEIQHSASNFAQS